MCRILKPQALESSITESPKSLIFTSAPSWPWWFMWVSCSASKTKSSAFGWA
jgi:hypothetical protein